MHCYPYSRHVGYPQATGLGRWEGAALRRLLAVDNQPARLAGYGVEPKLGLGDGGGRTIYPSPLEDYFQPVRRRRIPIQSPSNAALRAPFYKE